MDSYPYSPTFYQGDRVRVIRQSKYRKEELLGRTGTVFADSGTNVAVHLDGIKNHRSSYDCFYFKPNEVKLIRESEEANNEPMEEKTMEPITNYLNIATVCPINDPRTMYYYANYDPNLAVDDICVATSARRTKLDPLSTSGFIVAKVIGIEDASAHDVTGEIVSRVDISDYTDRVESRIKAAELKEKMEARAKQLQDIALYQMLAKDDPDMAALLAEYQGLNHK